MSSLQNGADKLLRVHYPLDYTPQYLILSNLCCKSVINFLFLLAKRPREVDNLFDISPYEQP